MELISHISWVLKFEPACSRRIKCDRQQPCSRCVQLGVAHECRPQTSKDEALSSLKTLLNHMDVLLDSQNMEGVLTRKKRSGSAQDDDLKERALVCKRSRYSSASLPMQICFLSLAQKSKKVSFAKMTVFCPQTHLTLVHFLSLLAQI